MSRQLRWLVGGLGLAAAVLFEYALYRLLHDQTCFARDVLGSSGETCRTGGPGGAWLALVVICPLVATGCAIAFWMSGDGVGGGIGASLLIWLFAGGSSVIGLLAVFGPDLSLGSGVGVGTGTLVIIIASVLVTPVILIAVGLGRRGMGGGLGGLPGGAVPPIPGIRGSGAPPPGAGRQPDRLDQLAKLGELRASGVLSDAEFEQQKRKLL